MCLGFSLCVFLCVCLCVRVCVFLCVCLVEFMILIVSVCMYLLLYQPVCVVGVCFCILVYNKINESVYIHKYIYTFFHAISCLFEHFIVLFLFIC